jgi:hypothetical protein
MLCSNALVVIIIDPGHQYVVWISRRIERFQFCAIIRHEQAIISRLKRLKFQWLDSYFSRGRLQAIVSLRSASE